MWRAGIAVLGFLAFSGVIGTTASAATEYPLLKEATGLFPESLSYLPRTKTFYVSGNGDGSVETFTVEGQPQNLQKAGSDGRKSGLGIKVDDTHDRLWVVSSDTIYIYQLSKNTLIRKINLFDVVPAIHRGTGGMNDLVIDSNGDAYVTESFHPILLKVDASRLDDAQAKPMSVFRDLTGKVVYDPKSGFPFKLNGIVFSPDLKSLLLSKTDDGTLWRVNLSDDGVSEVKLSKPIPKADGLVWGAYHFLYVIQNFENKISKINFDGGNDSTPRKVVTASPSELKIPTSAVYVVGALGPSLFVLNSQFPAKDGDKPTLPFSVFEFPLSELDWK